MTAQRMYSNRLTRGVRGSPVSKRQQIPSWPEQPEQKSDLTPSVPVTLDFITTEEINPGLEHIAKDPDTLSDIYIKTDINDFQPYRFRGEPIGDGHGSRYSIPYHISDPRYSGQEIEEEDFQSDAEFTRSCITAFSNLIGRRVARAMIDLIGIEPNPGPSALQKLVGQLTNVSSGGRVSKRKGKKRGKNMRNRQSDTSMPSNRVKISGVPSAFGMVAPRSYFRTSTSVQAPASQDTRNGMRAHGCALMQNSVSSFPTSSSSTPVPVSGGLASALSPDGGFLNITPANIDPRLNALAQTYQYYAFRRIAIKYIPFVGTMTNGGLYMAIGKDAAQVAYLYDVATPGISGYVGATPQSVMELDPCVMTPIWQPAGFEFRHLGTELWETFPNGEEPTNERIQACLVAILEGNLAVNAITTFGHVWLEYEIDFYVPGPPTNALAQQGASLFKIFQPTGQVAVTTSPTTGPVIGTINQDESVTGPVLISIGVTQGNSTPTLATFSLRNKVTGAITTIGQAVQLVASGVNTVTQVVLPVFIAAGIAYDILVAGSQNFTGSFSNSFVKSA